MYQYVCMSVCMYVRMCLCMCVCVGAFVCICIYVCMYVCCLCMYVSTTLKCQQLGVSVDSSDNYGNLIIYFH